MTPTIAPTTVDRYLEFWSLGPGDEQRRLGDLVFTPSVRYRAPLGERVGVAALLALAAEFATQFGALTMTARREPELHHDHARLQWELLRDGEPFAAGTDVLTFDADGRVAAVVTFVDRAPVGVGHHPHP